jgi:hypothetical protein
MFTRINNDINGNPRYVIHFLQLSHDYTRALYLAKQLGGKKFHNKQYGGGIVFQSYNTRILEENINDIKQREHEAR